jgi:hypothetical protein
MHADAAMANQAGRNLFYGAGERDAGRDREMRAGRDTRDWHERDFASDNERDDRFMPDYTNRDYGEGLQGLMRSDELIKELVSEALHDDEYVDASEITVDVKNAEVTLTGTVDDRRTKRMAEDCALRVAGVEAVQNQLRVRDHGSQRAPDAQDGRENPSNGSKHLRS